MPSGSRTARWTTTCALLMATAACRHDGRAAADRRATPVTLAIPGAQNRGASISANGNTVVVAWAATLADRTNVYSAVSQDAGRSFGTPVRVNDIAGDARLTGEQPPRVAVAPNGVVAIVWESGTSDASKVRLATSRDAGRTFSPAVTVNRDGVSGPRGWSSLALDRNGVPHVVWLDARRDTGPMRMGAGHVHGAGASPMEQGVFFASANATGVWTDARVARGACFCCKTAVAVAPDGAIYLAWRHVYPTNLRDIVVARSSDGGRTFSEPVRISEDGWRIEGCPEDGPSIAIDDGGAIHVAWPTIVEATSRKAVFYTWSSDGGRTFAPRVRVDATDTASAAHPVISVSGSRVAIAWEEREGSVSRVRTRAFVADTTGQVWTPERTARVISGDADAEYPAVTFAGNAEIFAWTTTPEGGASDIHVGSRD